MDQILLRRILGTALVLMLTGVTYLGMEARYSPEADTYEVDAVLGDAGSGLRQQSDVKFRGARIGEVAGLDYEDGLATAVLRFDDDPQLPPPEELEVRVTAKTLLGEKQIEVEIAGDELDDEGPFLSAGDTIEVSTEPTELSEAIAALEPFVDAIDGRDLAAIVDTLGEQAGEGERIAENIERGQELAAFGDRTAEDQLRNLRSLADIAEALAPRADDFNRLNDEIPGATEVLRTQEADIADNLDAVSRFAVGFSEFLETDEPLISEMLTSGDVVGRVLEQQQNQIGGLLNGLYEYTEKLGKGGLLLTDGTEWAPFRILLDMSAIDVEELLCAESDDEFPGCDDGDGSTPADELEGGRIIDGGGDS